MTSPQARYENPRAILKLPSFSTTLFSRQDLQKWCKSESTLKFRRPLKIRPLHIPNSIVLRLFFTMWHISHLLNPKPPTRSSVSQGDLSQRDHDNGQEASGRILRAHKACDRCRLKKIKVCEATKSLEDGKGCSKEK